MLNQKVLVSLKEFSVLTDLSLRTTNKLIATGELKSIRVGRRRLIPRIEIDRFARKDHSVRVTPTAALRRKAKPKRKRRILSKRRKVVSTKTRRVQLRKKPPRKRSRTVRLKKPTFHRIKRLVDPRIARALSYMRRTGASASDAAHREKIKLKSFVRGAGRSLYRPGPGKPWVVRSNDQLAFSMRILTRRGRVDAIVSNSRERRILHQFELALRMFRAGEKGAHAALKKLEGKKVGGHTLVTDVKLLIELEEAGELDFDNFYTAIGGRS